MTQISSLLRRFMQTRVISDFIVQAHYGCHYNDARTSHLRCHTCDVDAMEVMLGTLERPMEGNVGLQTCMLYQRRLTCDIDAMEVMLGMSKTDER
jgi:hypothetical protein